MVKKIDKWILLKLEVERAEEVTVPIIHVRVCMERNGERERENYVNACNVLQLKVQIRSTSLHFIWTILNNVQCVIITGYTNCVGKRTTLLICSEI